MTSQIDPTPLDQRHPPMWWTLRKFHMNLDALREMLEVVAPQLEELDQKQLTPDALSEVRTLAPDKREALSKYITQQVQSATAGDPSPPPPQEEITPRNAELSNSNSGQNTEPTEVDLNDIFDGDWHLVKSFFERLNRTLMKPRRVTIMRNSLLAQAISAFEVLISGIVTHFFILNQESLDGGQKAFSLKELQQFEDINDAIDALIEKRVTSLMYESIDEWSKWFEDRCKVRFEELAMDWERVREGFQRRHVTMHSEGRASRRYKAKVKKTNISEIGTRLLVDQEYLHRLMDELDVLGTSLGVMAWGTWAPEEHDLSAGQLLQRIYDLMLVKRWEAASGLASVGSKLKCSARVSESIRCNGWLSRMEMQGPDAVRQEVEKWDTSALTGIFKLVKLVLLGSLDDALRLVPDLLVTGELTKSQLQEWPILRALREHPRFEEQATIESYRIEQC